MAGLQLKKQGIYVKGKVYIIPETPFRILPTNLVNMIASFMLALKSGCWEKAGLQVYINTPSLMQHLLTELLTTGLEARAWSSNPYLAKLSASDIVKCVSTKAILSQSYLVSSKTNTPNEETRSADQ